MSHSRLNGKKRAVYEINRSLKCKLEVKAIKGIVVVAVED
jgi:hypothetical protein